MAAKKARAKHHVDPTVGDRPDQLIIIVWIIFQIGILDNHDVAGDVRERRFQRSSFTLIAGLKENLEPVERITVARVCLLQPLENFPAAILGAVVDKNDFLRDLDGTHAPHHFLQRAFLVINGDQNG